MEERLSHRGAKGAAMVVAVVIGALSMTGTPPVSSQSATGYAPIIAAHSFKVMDVLGAATTPTRIVQWAHNDGANQRWRVVPFSTVGPFQLFIIQSEVSGLVLDVAGGSTDSATALVQNPWSAATSQLWIVYPFGATGYDIIINVRSGMVADVSGASRDNGAQIIQWPWNGGLNQIWLVPAPVTPTTSSTSPTTTVTPTSTTVAPAECTPLEELLQALLGGPCAG